MDKPNILLIFADQHRYDCLGAYGNQDIKTPAIDALAQDGVLFENSFCPYPVCTPSRYSLLSSLYVHQHRGFSNRCTLPADAPSLPGVLRENGYRTGAVGKMHFTPTYLDIGFDEMALAEQDGAGRFSDDYHRWLREEGLCDRLDTLDQIHKYRKDAPAAYWEHFGAFCSDLDEEHHSTTWIGKRAVDMINRWNGGGNFLMVGFIKPHHPFDPPAPWHEMYDPAQLDLLPGWTEQLVHDDNGRGYFPYDALTETSLRRVMALYYATISQIDHHVERMVAELKARGLYDNTIIVYTADHGDYMGYHHRILKGYRMLEPVIRVPLILKPAEGTSWCGRDSRLVNNIDVAPTLLSLAGVSPPESMVGQDLSDETVKPEYVLAETHQEYMVRSRNRKLLRHRETQKSMFFDLENDPLEMINLIESPAHQAEISIHRDQLRDWPPLEADSEAHLDLAAPQCKADNVPQKETGMREYIHEAMCSEAPILLGL